MQPKWTTFRPDRRKLRIWFQATIAASLLLVGCFIFIEVQAAVFLLCALPVLIGVLGTILLRARLRYNEQQIEFRYMRSTVREWRDAIAWTCFGETDNPIFYIEFSDGRIIGSNQWLLNRAEIHQLIPHLLQKVGEPCVDGRTIVPWPYMIGCSQSKKNT